VKLKVYVVHVKKSTYDMYDVARAADDGTKHNALLNNTIPEL